VAFETESCAFEEKLQIASRQKLNNDLKAEESPTNRDVPCEANEADLCTNGWLMKNKFTAICIIINETIIFEM
jgi:hypothetical protein